MRLFALSSSTWSMVSSGCLAAACLLSIHGYHLVIGKGPSTLLSRHQAQSEMETYFDSLPEELSLTGGTFGDAAALSHEQIPPDPAYPMRRTSGRNAFHDPSMGTTLSSTTPWSGTLDVLPARSARKDLVTYFSQLPTHEVNFYHDFSKPAHHHMHSRHPTRHGLDRGSAYREIEHYYSNVPSRDVNPNHDPADPPKHSRVHAFSSEVAMRDMNDFYDRQDPGNMQVARPAVAKNKAKLSDTSSDSQESRATSLGFGAGHSDCGQLVAGSNQVEASVKAAIGTVGTAAVDTVGKGNLLPRSSIAYIQQWGHDADAPTDAELAFHRGNYDTNIGMKDDLVDNNLEDTPSGPVQTSFANNASVKAVGSSKMLGRTSAEAEQQRIREQQERSSDVKQTLHAGRGLSEQEQGQSRDLQDTIRTHEEKIAHLRSVTDDRQHNDGHIVQAERQETLPFEVKDRDKTVERHQQQQLRHVSRARAMHARNRAEKAAGSGEMFAAEKGLSSKTQLTGRLGQVVGLGLCSIVGIACD